MSFALAQYADCWQFSEHLAFLVTDADHPWAHYLDTF